MQLTLQPNDLAQGLRRKLRPTFFAGDLPDMILASTGMLSAGEDSGKIWKLQRILGGSDQRRDRPICHGGSVRGRGPRRRVTIRGPMRIGDRKVGDGAGLW